MIVTTEDMHRGENHAGPCLRHFARLNSHPGHHHLLRRSLDLGRLIDLVDLAYLVYQVSVVCFVQLVFLVSLVA